MLLKQNQNRLRTVVRNKALLISATLSLSVLLTACGGPTYGTGETSSQQLVNDFSNITRWNSLTTNEQVNTRPRPKLIKPSAADLNKPLPLPQQSLAGTHNANWPESPEERRARLQQEATRNQDNPNYVSPIKRDTNATAQNQPYAGVDRTRRRENRMPSPSEAKKQAELYREMREAERGPSSGGSRKYLSEPPSSYFVPSENAPKGDLGKSEDEKQQSKSTERTSIFGK